MNSIASGLHSYLRCVYVNGGHKGLTEKIKSFCIFSKNVFEKICVFLKNYGSDRPYKSVLGLKHLLLQPKAESVCYSQRAQHMGGFRDAISCRRPA